MILLEETSKTSDAQLNIAAKNRLSRNSKSSKPKQGKKSQKRFHNTKYSNSIDKSKLGGNDHLTARKSQDISSIIESEKVASKKSIYLKSAEFLLKYNIATV